MGRKIKNASLLKGHPIFGRLFNLLKPNGIIDNLQAAGEIAEKDPLGRCYFWVGNILHLVVTRPEDVRQVTMFNHQHLSRARANGKKDPTDMEKIVGNFLGLHKDENWKLKKEVFRHNFATTEALQRLEAPTIKLAESTIQRFSKLKHPFELNDLTTDYIINIVGEFLIGMENITDIIGPLVKLNHEMAQEAFEPKSIARWALPQFLRNRYFPGKLNTIPALRQYLENEVYKTILAPNENHIKSNSNLPFHQFWKIQNKLLKQDLPIKEGLYTDAIMSFAAVDNAKAALEFIIKLVANHPEVNKKLKLAIRNQLRDQEFTAKSVDAIPYLEMVINEAIRLYPPTIVNPMGLESPFTLLNHVPTQATASDYQQLLAKEKNHPETALQLIRGDVVNISPYLTQHMSAYFKEPDKFIPERFEDQTITSNASFFPFGMGMQACIGKRYAMMLLKVFLAKLYLQYDVTISDNDFELKLVAGVLAPQKPTPVTMQAVRETVT